MKTATHFRMIVELAIAAAVLGVASPSVSAAPKVKGTGKAATVAKTNDAAEAAIDLTTVGADVSAPIPQSVFSVPKAAGDGRDPFFPSSTRLFGEVSPSKTNAAPARIDLVLKGLAGSAGDRFATINSSVFAEGEEREMNVADKRVKVRCLEIREDAVVIEVGGVRRTLRMREGP